MRSGPTPTMARTPIAILKIRESGRAGDRPGSGRAGDRESLTRSHARPRRLLIEADDLHPIRPFTGRISADQLQGAAGGVDRVGGEGVRLLTGDDHVAPGGVDAEAARLLFRGRAAEPGEIAGGGVHAEGADRVAGALGRVEEFPVRRQVQVGRPDVVAAVALRRGRAARPAGDELAV